MSGRVDPGASCRIKRNRRSPAIALPIVAVALTTCSLLVPISEEEYGGGSRVSIDLEDRRCESDSGCILPPGTWLEIGTFAGACPNVPNASLPLLVAEAGRSDHPLVSSVPPPSDLALTGVGKGQRAFFALLRHDDCSVLAWGCTDALLDGQRSVTIGLQTQGGPPVGACRGGSCDCPDLPQDGGSEGAQDAGAVCDLALVAAGNLSPPLALDEIEAGPSVVALVDRFLVASRAQDLAGLSSTSRV